VKPNATLLAFRMVVSMGCSSLIIVGDSIFTILALKDLLLVSYWISAPVISNFVVQLHFINV
jgi:hypothetical protein